LLPIRAPCEKPWNLTQGCCKENCHALDIPNIEKKYNALWCFPVITLDGCKLKQVAQRIPAKETWPMSRTSCARR